MNPGARKPLVAGNWKMHGSHAEAARLVGELITRGTGAGTAEAVVCPPFVFLAELRRQLDGSRIGLGAQDVCAEELGAFTGEVSAGMLADIGANWAIVGHSERRQYHGESDALVARKFAAVRAGGLTPILCVGETLAERDAGHTRQVIGRQLAAVIELNGIASFDTAVIAYEPIWAIGTGQTASPEQAQEVHAFIRSQLTKEDVMIARLTRLLYGGSVKAANAAALFAQPDVDGGLIGGASLVASDFLGICAAAH